jgi:hypothetical protein
LLYNFDKEARSFLIKPMFTSDDDHELSERSEIIAGVKNADFGLTLFPLDTMAALLDRSLFGVRKRQAGPGAEPRLDEKARILTLLDEKARILTRDLEQMIEDARARRREKLDELRRE